MFSDPPVHELAVLSSVVSAIAVDRGRRPTVPASNADLRAFPKVSMIRLPSSMRLMDTRRSVT
jgi:hypothetical protein